MLNDVYTEDPSGERSASGDGLGSPEIQALLDEFATAETLTLFGPVRPSPRPKTRRTSYLQAQDGKCAIVARLPLTDTTATSMRGASIDATLAARAQARWSLRDRHMNGLDGEGSPVHSWPHTFARVVREVGCRRTRHTTKGLETTLSVRVVVFAVNAL